MNEITHNKNKNIRNIPPLLESLLAIANLAPMSETFTLPSDKISLDFSAEVFFDNLSQKTAQIDEQIIKYPKLREYLHRNGEMAIEHNFREFLQLRKFLSAIADCCEQAQSNDYFFVNSVLDSDFHSLLSFPSLPSTGVFESALNTLFFEIQDNTLAVESLTANLISALQNLDVRRIKKCRMCQTVFWVKRFGNQGFCRRNCGNKKQMIMSRIKKYESELADAESALEKALATFPSNPRHPLVLGHIKKVKKLEKNIKNQKNKLKKIQG